jgi:hypothetical protein
MMTELTAERLREVLNYDPATGVFTWLVRTARCRRIGEVAGCGKNGYHQIGIDRRRYRAHRLAWLYMTGEWPAQEIDHINGDPSDNRITNLRPATSSQNKTNSRRRSDNNSGYKGVSFDRSRQKWQARISVAGRSARRLGRFDCPVAAHAAYVAAAEKHFGEFARAE